MKVSRVNFCSLSQLEEVHTISKSIDDSPNDELRKVPGEKLKDSPNRAECRTDTQGILPSEFVSVESCQKTSHKVTELLDCLSDIEEREEEPCICSGDILPKSNLQLFLECLHSESVGMCL